MALSSLVLFIAHVKLYFAKLLKLKVMLPYEKVVNK